MHGYNAVPNRTIPELAYVFIFFIEQSFKFKGLRCSTLNFPQYHKIHAIYIYTLASRSCQELYMQTEACFWIFAAQEFYPFMFELCVCIHSFMNLRTQVMSIFKSNERLVSLSVSLSFLTTIIDYWWVDLKISVVAVYAKICDYPIILITSIVSLTLFLNQLIKDRRRLISFNTRRPTRRYTCALPQFNKFPGTSN